GRFGEHESRAADRAAAEVDEMPVVRHAIDRRVLAHRRYRDAVSKDGVADGTGFEEVHGREWEWGMGNGEWRGLKHGARRCLRDWKRAASLAVGSPALPLQIVRLRSASSHHASDQ